MPSACRIQDAHGLSEDPRLGCPTSLVRQATEST